MDALRIRLQPKQSDLWDLWNNSPFTRIGFGGARGGAKSGGGRRCMLLRRLEYPITTGLIIRRTFPELYKSHIVKMYEEYPEIMQYYNTSNKELALPESLGGSRLFFGSAEHEKDMSAFYSAEFADIMPDEAQEFSQDELERLSGSNRCTSNSEILPKMVLPFMPGTSEAGLPPRGLSYLKRTLVDGKLTAEEQKEKWAFIQAYSWDNIEWFRKELTQDGIGSGAHKPEARHCICMECEFYSWSPDRRRDYFIDLTAYGRKLAALTDKNLRDAWLYGKWDTFQGQYFQQFSEAKHKISMEELRRRVKPWHKRWASGDWGYDHPHSVYRHAQDEIGRIITYGEIWGREVNETKLGQTIAERYSDDPVLSGFAFSWDAGKLSKRSAPNFPKSINQMISDALPGWMPKPHPADSSPGSRIARARLTGQLLDSSMWQIAEDCPRLLACIPSLLKDPKNPEDVLKIDYSENYIGDDPYDGATMGLQYMAGTIPIVPQESLSPEDLEAWTRAQREQESVQ